MTAPFFKAVGTVANGAGTQTAISPTLAINDIALAWVASNSGNPSTPTGWTRCSGSPASTSAPFFNLYWQRAASAGTLSFTAAGTIGFRSLVIESYGGCITTGDPTEAGTGLDNASSASISIPSITTLGADRLVVLGGASALISGTDTVGSLVNAALSSLATRFSQPEQNSGSVNFGLVLGDGGLAAAGSTGPSSASLSSAASSSGIAIALIPASTTPGLAGTADVAFTATATGSGVGALIGSAGLALAATAVIAAAGALSGSANLSLAATGTATGTGALAGSSNLTFTASGTPTNSFNLRGAANLSFTATATPQGRAAIAGTAPLVLTATAHPTAAGKLAGAAPLAFSSAGTLSGIGSLAGDASLLWTASGSPTSIISIGGEADLVFTATLTPPRTYIGDGRYYVQIAARPFYVSLPPRSFYAQMPVRSFYILSDPDMTPIFDTKDPRETVVLTFDASSDLAAGETLTGTPTIEITLQRGADPDAADVVTAPEINTQQITIPLDDGTQATIATGHCVQAIAEAGLDGCWYLVAITCTTSNPEKVLTLKGVLKVSAS